MAQAPFVTSPALVNIVIDYAATNRAARGYIADAVAPRVAVDAPEFKFPRFAIEDAFTVVDNQIGRLSQANELGYRMDELTDSVLDYALRTPVPFRDELAARAGTIPFALRARAARNTVDKNQLNREIRVAALTTTAGNYSAGYVRDLATSGPRWSDFANSDPVADVQNAIRSMLVRGNVGVTNEASIQMLQRHPKISVALGGSAESGRVVPVNEIATLFGLSRIEVGSTMKQTSKRGQSLVTGDVWPDFFAIHYQGPLGPDNLSLDYSSPNFLHTFQWQAAVASETRYDPGDMGLFGGIKVLAGESLKEKICAPFAGFLFQNVR